MPNLRHIAQTMRTSLTRWCVFVMLALAFALPAHAVEPDEILPDARLERRARALSTELRCLVCQNQSIDDSNAPLARDLRLLVRERLTAGETDAQVMRFITDRYGQFVLLNPPVGRNTALLWATPVLLLAAAAFALWRRNGTSSPAPAEMTADEQNRLKRLLDGPVK
jgi:cytochrome c-type biogenesis protein CcmH